MKLLSAVLLSLIAIHLTGCGSGGGGGGSNKPIVAVVDTDGDKINDDVDSDDDNDGTADTLDAFPLNANEKSDNDKDGQGDTADTDDDNDGIADNQDKFPLDAKEQLDTDQDGIGNNADTDDDNDGVIDTQDKFPLDAKEQLDADKDGTGDAADLDDDNDGSADIQDKFPFDPQEQLDTDLDGIGNNADTDDDNDGAIDTKDQLPLDPKDQWDFDKDGVGDNTDTDDDNNGVADVDDSKLGAALESAVSIPANAKVIADANRDWLFISSPDEKRVAIINQADGKLIKSFSFNEKPEAMVLSTNRNKLYIALLVSGHQYYGAGDGTGKIAVVDLEKLSVERTFDIDIDPFDMVINSANKLVISSGSGQWSKIAAYDGTTGVLLSSVSQIRFWSHLELATDNLVLSMETEGNNGLAKFDISSNTIQLLGSQFGSPTFPVGGDAWLEPKNQYLITRSGSVIQAEDQKFVKSLDLPGSAIKFVEFNAESNTGILVLDNNTTAVLNLTEMSIIKLLPAAGDIRNANFTPHYLRVIKTDQLNKGLISLEQHPCPRCQYNRAPKADFSVSSLTGLTTDTLKFDASLSTDADNDSLQYRWDFDGNGTWDTDYSASATSSFKYVIPGSYKAKVQIKDAAAATASKIQEIKITLAENAGVPVQNASANIFNFPLNNGLFDGKSSQYFLDAEKKRIYLVDIAKGLAVKYFETLLPPREIVLSADKKRLFIIESPQVYDGINSKTYVSTIDIENQKITAIVSLPFSIRKLLDANGKDWLIFANDSYPQLKLVEQTTANIRNLPENYFFENLYVGQTSGSIYQSSTFNFSKFSLNNNSLTPSESISLPNYFGGLAWLSPNEKNLVTAGGQMYDLASSKSINIPVQDIVKVHFDTAHKTIFVISARGFAQAYNANSFELITNIDVGKPIQDMVILGDKLYLAITGTNNLNGIIEYPHPCISCGSNQAPQVSLLLPAIPTVGQKLVLDASATVDEMISSLLFRWDFNSDGIWDTPFLSSSKQEKSFQIPGVKLITVQAKDKQGETGSATVIANLGEAEISADILAETNTQLATATPDTVLSIPGKNAFVVLDKINKKIHLVDFILNRATHSFDLEFAPEQGSVTPDGQALYVSMVEPQVQNIAAKYYIVCIDLKNMTIRNTLKMADSIGAIAGISNARAVVYKNGFSLQLINTLDGTSITNNLNFGNNSPLLVSADGKMLYAGFSTAIKIENEGLTPTVFRGNNFSEKGWLLPDGKKMLSSASVIYATSTLDTIAFLAISNANIIDAKFDAANHLGYLLLNNNSLAVINTESFEIVKTISNWGNAKALAYLDGQLYTLAAGNEGWAIKIDKNPCPECLQNKAPVAKLTLDQEKVDTASTVIIDASSSEDPEMGALSYRWDLNGDGVWDGNFTTMNKITRKYVIAEKVNIALQVKDNAGNIASTSLLIDVQQAIDYGNTVSAGQPFKLDFVPQESLAEPGKGKLYSMDKHNKRIYVVDIKTGAVEKYFALDYQPEAMAMSSDGKKIYIAQLGSGHNYNSIGSPYGFISTIDTSESAIVKTLKINIDPSDMVALKDDRLAISSGSDQHTVVMVMNTSTGESLGTGYIYMGARLATDPAGIYFYASEVSISPSDVNKFSYENSIVKSFGDSPYHGDYGLGGNIWVTPDGKHVISQSGDTLHTENLKFYKDISPANSIIHMAFTPDNVGHVLLQSGEIIDLAPASLDTLATHPCTSCVDIFTLANEVYAIKKMDSVSIIEKQ